MIENLIEHHLGYAHAMVSDFAGKYPPSVTRGDLNGAAELGLVQAAHSYDPARGASFATFAYFRIRGAIFDEIRKTWRYSYLSSAQERGLNEQDGGGEVQVAEVLSQEEPLDPLANLSPARHSAVIDPETLPDPRESPANCLLKQEQSERIRAAFHQLPPRHKFVMQAYYYDGMSMMDIGQHLKLSKSWVSRIHTQALAMIRESLESPHVGRCRQSKHNGNSKSSPLQRRKTPRGVADNSLKTVARTT